MLDVLIRGGWVADGSGKPRFPADVAIEGDRVVEAAVTHYTFAPVSDLSRTFISARLKMYAYVGPVVSVLEMKSTPIDVVTLEVIKNALGSTVDEMALIVARTAYSGTVRDALDYSTALCNPRGEMVAQGLGIAMHLGSFPSAVKSILTRYKDSLYAGDIFILNDPYGSGGIHLPDIYVIKPIFIDDELEGLSCVVAHHTDVGGIVPGSNSTTATEIYQEGLRIPTLKLYERGVRNEAIFALIEHNVRVPDKVLGDLRAQLAAVTSGERAYLELANRYGTHTLRRYTDELLNYSERLARAEIAAIPDGVYEFADYIDHDSVDPDPITIKVTLTVAGDQIVVDFDGSSPQVRGGINCPLPFTESAVYAAIRLTLDPSLPNSAGYFRPIEVRAPLRSIVNPVLPGACGARGITGFRIIDAVLGALSQAVPERVPADGEGGNTLITLGGYDDGHRFVYVELFSGARGAGPWGDGQEGVPHPGSNNANTPIEIAESGYPLLFEWYGMVPDSGGAGKYRGGLGLVRQFRYLANDTIMQLRSDKRRFPPYGLYGGRAGTPSLNVINPAQEDERTVATIGIALLRHGEVFRHVLAGGGGWGDPLERDPSLIRADVWNEKVSLEGARRAYGVVIDPLTLVVDEVATSQLRQQLRGEPPSPLP